MGSDDSWSGVVDVKVYSPDLGLTVDFGCCLVEIAAKCLYYAER